MTPEKVQRGPDVLEDLRIVISSQMQHCYDIRWNLKVNTRFFAKELSYLLYWNRRGHYMRKTKPLLSHFRLKFSIP